MAITETLVQQQQMQLDHTVCHGYLTFQETTQSSLALQEPTVIGHHTLKQASQSTQLIQLQHQQMHQTTIHQLTYTSFQQSQASLLRSF
jgi:hypothetical protein